VKLTKARFRPCVLCKRQTRTEWEEDTETGEKRTLYGTDKCEACRWKERRRKAHHAT
jgi:hypothetical protein